MIEARCELDFAEKTLRSEGRREVGMQNLEGDDSVVLAVLGEIHGRHAATAELAVDGVGICKRVAQPLDGECQTGLLDECVSGTYR